VADVDEVDALGAAAVVDREQVAAGEREELRHAVRLEAARDQAAAVQLRRLLRLRGHRGGTYPPDPGVRDGPRWPLAIRAATVDAWTDPTSR
jgi:hypothetical protein